MLGGAGLNGRGVMPAIARQRLTAFPRSSRSISSLRNLRSFGGYGRLSQTLVGGLAWRATSSVPGPMFARFNSTSSGPSDAASSYDGDMVAPGSQLEAGDISNLSLSDIESIPEHIGYLKDLGLDYGWGPSSIIQYVIEHIHIWSGLPWWASIVGTGLLVRLALLYPMMGAADNAAKMQNVKPLTDPLRLKMLHQNATGNLVEVTKLRAEQKKIQEENGIHMARSFVPFIQIPFGFGCYRVVKGMTAMPVPGLATESVGWLKDLTVADPTFLLPALSATCMYLTFRRGGEDGMNEMMNSSFGKALLYGMPAVGFAFMAFFPSALQLYFLSTGIFALGQAYLLHNHNFRRFANIAIAQKHQSSPASPLGARGIKLIEEFIKEEEAKNIERKKQNPEPTPEISLIDRLLDSYKTKMANIQREARDKMNEVSGKAPANNPDGSPAAQPRLSDKDLKLASDYERRRKEEEDWKREERNHARREAYMRLLAEQREKARESLERNATRSKDRE